MAKLPKPTSARLPDDTVSDTSAHRRCGKEALADRRSGTQRAKFLAGGTNLVDLMRENDCGDPSILVDVSGLS